MDSIILLVLIGIASSVFQAVNKNKKEQKKVAADAYSNKTNVQPKVQPKVRLRVQPINEAISESYVSMESDGYQVEMPMEALGNVLIQDKVEEPSSASSLNWMGNITFDELQRSIVMAEILGKPKALRKTAR